MDHLINSDANAKRIQRVESSFTAGEPLMKPGRVLLGEGVLTKICKKKGKARQFFLFNDILVYGNIVINNKKFKQFNKQRVIPLEEIKLGDMEDEGNIRNGWFICSRSKSFAVFASTPIEKQQWIDHINRAVADHVRHAKVILPSTFAATMVPDSEAKSCMHCQKSQFTFVNRRHHCRKCGYVIGACCSQFAVIPEQSNKSQRVCPTCAAELQRIEQRNGRLSNGSMGNTPESPAPEESDDDSYGSPNGSRQAHSAGIFYDRESHIKRLSSEDEGQSV
ncbi:hypothetical protein RvY_08126 [Ramazzottius varieornatus]|uniref:FYVE-type domain-containing protein n=1 Tax=Ramazzottius varieornatus TaxID=947166 RepID=A0A1D1V7H6_RAMVA|nr:hypothetical protein RvY_08126 [Ramazzottius varieornatus]